MNNSRIKNFHFLVLLALAAPVTCDSLPNKQPPKNNISTHTDRTHPFLFYDQSDRDKIQSRIKKHPWSRWWKTLKQNTHIHSTPAFTWWITNKKGFAIQAKGYLLKEEIWRDPEHGYLEPSSHHLSDFVVTYDLLAAWEGLHPEDHKIIRHKIRKEAQHYYNTLSEGVPGGANFGNQRVLAASVMGLAALVLKDGRDEDKAYDKWLQRAIHEIFRIENFWFFRPGGHFIEGLGYTKYMADQFIPFVIAYHRATETNLLGHPRLRKWLEFAAYQLTNNGTIIPWGTAQMDVGLGYFGLLTNTTYGGNLSSLLRTAFNLPEHPHFNPYHNHIALALHDEPPKTNEDTKVAASKVFYNSQTVTIRENWDNNAVSIWFAGKDPSWLLKHRYETYSHADTGHFVLSAWGEFLTSDSGYDHWETLGKPGGSDYAGPEFHNVILIDGKGPDKDTEGILSNASLQGAVKHATITSKYQDCVIKRTLFLVRERYVVVVDKITAKKKHHFTWQLHSSSPDYSKHMLISNRSIEWAGAKLRGQSILHGETSLTTIVPSYTNLSVIPGRWRPKYSSPENMNHVALSKWTGFSGAHLFLLLPNNGKQRPISWKSLGEKNMEVHGADWTDSITLDNRSIHIVSSDEVIDFKIDL